MGQVLPGGGAAEAGLLPGDGILRVDGQAVAALGFTEAIQRIRGPEGSRRAAGPCSARAARRGRRRARAPCWRCPCPAGASVR